MPVNEIALVTCANRGIRFEVRRQLARQGLHVILTSRDGAKGRAAMENLRSAFECGRATGARGGWHSGIIQL